MVGGMKEHRPSDPDIQKATGSNPDSNRTSNTSNPLADLPLNDKGEPHDWAHAMAIIERLTRELAEYKSRAELAEIAQVKHSKNYRCTPDETTAAPEWPVCPACGRRHMCARGLPLVPDKTEPARCCKGSRGCVYGDAPHLVCMGIGTATT